MPIVIQQPSPQAPAITAAGAAATMFSHDLPTLAHIYRGLGGGGGGGGGAGAAAIQHSYDVLHQQELQAGEYQQSRQPSERDAFLAQEQFQLQNQRAQNAAWLQGQELSQQEAMQLQRDQNAVGYVQQAAENFKIDKNQANDIITQLRTRIDPARQRLEASQAKMQEAHSQQLMAEAARTKAMENVHMQGAPMMDADGEPIIDRATGEPARFYTTKSGEIKQVPSANPVMTEEQWQTAYSNIEKQVDARIKEMALGQPNRVMSDEERYKTWQGLMEGTLGGRGMGADYEDYLRQRREAYQSRKAPGSAAPPSAGSAAAGGPGSQPAQGVKRGLSESQVQAGDEMRAALEQKLAAQKQAQLEYSNRFGWGRAGAPGRFLGRQLGME
jgi:hypothetical protein